MKKKGSFAYENRSQPQWSSFIRNKCSNSRKRCSPNALNSTKSVGKSGWYTDWDQVNTQRHFTSSQLIMLCKVQTGPNEDPFHGLPVIVMIRRQHAMYFPLAPDWVTILFACYGKEHICAYVLEAYRIIPVPVGSAALHYPYVQVISFSIIPKGADFLFDPEKETSNSQPGE